MCANATTAAAKMRAAVSAPDGKRRGCRTVGFGGQRMMTTAGVSSGFDQLDCQAVDCGDGTAG
jgi:hypothetical protein